MGWWIVLGLLALIAVLPVGISVRYNEDGPLVGILAGPLKLQVFPAKKKKKEKSPQKPKSQKQPKKPAAQPAKKPAAKKKGGDIRDFFPFVQLALDFLGDFRRKLRIKRLEVKVILAGSDPADLAINYGRIWAALGNLWPQLEKLFVIQKRDVQVECDFTADKTLISAWVDISITVGRLLWLVFGYGIRAVKEFLKLRKKSKGGAVK